MFHEHVEALAGTDGSVTAASVLSSFETALREAVDGEHEQIASMTDLEASTLGAVVDGDVGSLTVTEGASVLAATSEHDADAIIAELRDHLLMGMTTAVLDVDSIAAAIDADLTGQEVQQALEGRAAMTLAQLAEVLAVIETRKP